MSPTKAPVREKDKKDDDKKIEHNIDTNNIVFAPIVLMKTSSPTTSIQQHLQAQLQQHQDQIKQQQPQQVQQPQQNKDGGHSDHVNSSQLSNTLDTLKHRSTVSESRKRRGESHQVQEEKTTLDSSASATTSKG